MDPFFLFLLFWPQFRMRPLVIEYIYRLQLLSPVMKLIKGLPIPNFDTSVNQIKVRKAEESIQKVADGLKRGKNFVLYPSGRLKSSGREVLGGSSGVHALVQECPEANVVLVRTTGLWGSSFSRALLGRSPDLSTNLLHGIKAILKNGIFFCPRREVDIEIEVDPKDLPRGVSRVEFNRFLEHWYNRYPNAKGKIHDVEPLTLVSYAFWKKDLAEVFHQPKKHSLSGEISITPETRSKVYDEIRRILNDPGIEIGPEKKLATDLAMDSLNIAELIAFLALTYDVEELHPEDMETVQNVLEIAEGARTSDRPAKQAGHIRWPEEKGRPAPALPLGRTIPEAFLLSCQRMENFDACGDDLIGVLSYKKMRRSILVLAGYFKKLPDQRIAVLLPASAAAYLTILALQMAGKVPVMLNWTLGPRYLDEMMNLSGATIAISSWRFLERLAHVEFGSLIDKIVLLEDIRKKISLGSKLKGAFLSLTSPSFILRCMKLRKIDENAPCVILFTSGTEASPKGVPLSHKNILSNLRSSMQCISFAADDCLYGILPPFHSFGFTVAGLFPLLGGIKVAFYPDPTDSFALAEGIQRWKITLFCSAPSFLKGLFSAAKPGQLDSVRIFISGAEKAPSELHERVVKLGTGAFLAEGYGITECSPVLTINRFNLPPKGVGTPLPDVEICTIHPETLDLLPKGSEGEICARGPNIFNGYLGNPRTPFIEINDERWYRTGDLGYLDGEGNLILSGRLKRFTKVGGEMISLGAIEQILAEELIKKGQISVDVSSLAVCSDERVPGKPQLVLFITITLDREEANEILKNAGFSRLVKISAVKKIEEIPMMGTGKTDYRRLQGLI
jgi:long-chain-fatty-acid--[acyl-carrier-protein] ligase